MTPFIGREKELADLARLLVDPQVRLLTVLGAGGVGKTRLALEVARAQLPHYPNGVFFVSLAPLESLQSIVPAIAEAVGFQFYQGVEPRQQILNYLEHKTTLLVLDNCEHLLEGLDIVTEILKTAPGVRILATSRARLNLDGEQRYPLGGMDFPDPISQEVKPLEDALAFSSVRLFLQGAQRAVPGYAPEGEELVQIVRICKMLGGSPLAIRLASAWVELLPPGKIADEIEKSIDFLETERRDVPERQRSMRAVFDHSWGLLGEKERAVFASLSVFRGGFTLEAAEEVAGATLKVLMALVDRALVQRDGNERYTLHELLRQFAERKLAEDPAAQGAAREKHSAYYCDRLASWEKELKSAGQVAALNEMDVEIENCRLAWEWVVSMGWSEKIDQSIESFYLYSIWRNRIDEGIALFTFAETVFSADTDQDMLTLARILLKHFDLLPNQLIAENTPVLFERGQALVEKAQQAGLDVDRETAHLFRIKSDLSTDAVEEFAYLEKSLEIFTELEDQWEIAWIHNAMGVNQVLQGNRRKAESCYKTSISVRKGIGDEIGYASSINAMVGFLTTALGKFQEGNALLDEAVAISEKFGFTALSIAILIHKGSLQYLLGRYEEALSIYHSCLKESENFGFQYGIAMSIGGQGIVAWAKKELDSASELLKKSVNNYREYLQNHQLVYLLSMLSSVYTASGQYSNAKQALLEAMQLCSIKKNETFVYWLILPAYALLIARQDCERAIEIFALASQSPMVSHSNFHKDVFKQPILEAAACLPPDAVAAAEARGRARDPWQTARELLAELEAESEEGQDG